MTEVVEKAIVKGVLIIELFGPDGKCKQVEIVENLITTYGKEAMADQLINAPTLGKPKYLAVGTSNTAAAAGDKKLVAQDGTRAEWTERTRSAKVITMVKEFGAGEHTATLQEAGVFTESTGENAMSRIVFTAMEKGAEDTVKFTWKYTYE